MTVKWKTFTEIFMANVIVHLKAPLSKLLKDFNELVQWKIKKKEKYSSSDFNKMALDLILKMTMSYLKKRWPPRSYDLT